MKQPLVIGYKGEMGSFILNGLLRVMPKALDIWCADVNETEDEVKERINKSDAIFICVPMSKTIDWIVTYQKLLSNKMLLEQCSLKEWIYDDERVKDLDIRSMHILFRPSGTPLKEDRRLALFDGQFEDDMVEKLLEITDSNLVMYKDAKEHDREMAIQQSLVHRSILLLDEALKDCKGSTYVSKRVIELANRIKKGNVELYKLIQDNKHLPSELEKMISKFETFRLEKYFAKD